MSDDRCDLLCLDFPKAERLRGSRMPAAIAQQRSAAARALGEPSRLVLAAALREGGELCVCDLSWIVERSEKLVSHHVRAMRSAGVVSSRRQGKMVMYSLTEQGQALLETVLAQPVSM